MSARARLGRCERSSTMNDTDVLEPPPRAARSRLEYKADPAGGPVTVRGIRLLVVLTLVNTTLLGMSVLGPQLFPFLRQQWAQWRASRGEAEAGEAAAGVPPPGPPPPAP